MQQSPKNLLMEAANMNPQQALLVTITNGQLAYASNYASAHDALLMLFVLRGHVEELIKLSLGSPSKLNNPPPFTTVPS